MCWNWYILAYIASPQISMHFDRLHSIFKKIIDDFVDFLHFFLKILIYALPTCVVWQACSSLPSIPSTNQRALFPHFSNTKSYKYWWSKHFLIIWSIPHIIFKLLCYKASNYTDISIIRYYKCQIQICDYQYLHWILEHSIILSTNIF